MIHYHGTPITPEVAAVEALTGGHGMVSFAHPDQLALVQNICQSYCVDNGAFSAWKSGRPRTNWDPYVEWVAQMINHPRFDWAIIPDVIDGTELENDTLAKWFCRRPGLRERAHLLVPVYHLHESIERLQILAKDYPRIALGSSGQFATIGTDQWHDRMRDCMAVLCESNGVPKVKIHGLRMLDPEIVALFPFSSADSTNLARNIGIDGRWARGPYGVQNKPARARILRQRIESSVSPSIWMGGARHPEFDFFVNEQTGGQT